LESFIHIRNSNLQIKNDKFEERMKPSISAIKSLKFREEKAGYSIKINDMYVKDS